MVGLGRLELPTLRLSGVRSNHLSYRPMTTFAGISLRARDRTSIWTIESVWKEKRRRRRSAHLCASSALSGASIVS